MSFAKEQIAIRQKLNKEILKELAELVEKHENQRFGQILCNYVFTGFQLSDSMNFKTAVFNEEPAKTLGNLMLKRDKK